MKNADAKAGFSFAVAMAKAAERLGDEYGDRGLHAAGQGLEARAQAALDQGQLKLDYIN